MTGRLLLGTVHSIVASIQVWPIINTMVEMSFFASPTAMQRSLSDRSRRQRLKNGKKGTHVVSLYFVRSTKLNYDCLKITGEIGSRVQQAREQATSSIMLPVTFTKLWWPSRKLIARELGVGQHCATWTMIGRFFVIDGRQYARKDGEQVQCVLHDGKRELTVHQISCVVGTRISPWSWLGPSVPHARLSEGLH